MVKKIIIGVVVIFVVLVIIGMATGGSNKGTEKVGSTTNPSTNNEKATTQQPENITYKIADQVKSGDFVFSVNSARKDAGTGIIKPKEGSIYVIPNVSIQNNSKSEANISTLLQMYVKDSEGNKYTPTITQDATGKVDGELLEGETIKGEVGFEIPTTATGLKFYYQPEWLGGSSTIVVDLGI